MADELESWTLTLGQGEVESSEEKEEFPSGEQEVYRNTLADLYRGLARGSPVHVAGPR
jgi:hypothetical protein